jgi:toxin ParE1/3/4
MSRYAIARRAQEDLDGIWDHIALDHQSPDAADRFLDLLFEKFRLLASHPNTGESRKDLEDLITGVRSFSVKSYEIYFQPTAHGVRISRVLHGARDVRAALAD